MFKYNVHDLVNSHIDKIIIVDRCDSTMNIAKIWQEETNLLILAEEQIRGRGQKQREWLSPANSGIWGTIVLTGNFSALAQKTAVALCQALERLKCPETIQIKWPNDIFLSGKKSAGILIEGEHIAQKQLWRVGFGLTINQVNLKDSMPLSEHWPEHPRREIIILAFLDAFFEILDLPDIITAYQKYDLLAGKALYGGIANGINKHGALQIVMPDGSISNHTQ